MTVRDLCLVEPRLGGDEPTPRVGGSLRGVRGGALPAEHGGGDAVGSGGVLLGGGQAAGRGDGERCARVHRRPAPPPGRWQGGPSRRRRGRFVGSNDQAASWRRCRGSSPTSDDHRGGQRRTRCPAGCRLAGGADAAGVPLVRTPRTLPKVLDPGEVNALLGALRRWRDRAMVEAMVLGGLRRCEVLGLRLEDLRPVERRVFIADGKGGHQRLVPISGRFFASVARFWMPNAHGKRPLTECSWCSRAPGGVDRCPRTGSMRSCEPPEGGLVSPTPPATSCATPA